MLHAIRATGERYEYSVSDGVVVIDFSCDRSVEDFNCDKAALVQYLLTTPYNSKIGTARTSASQLLRFSGCELYGHTDPISAGDVVLYVLTGEKVSIGEIQGGYSFVSPNPYGDVGGRHFRKAVWHIRDMPLSEFESEFGFKPQSSATVFRPGGNDETRHLEIENRARRYIERD